MADDHIRYDVRQSLDGWTLAQDGIDKETFQTPHGAFDAAVLAAAAAVDESRDVSITLKHNRS